MAAALGGLIGLGLLIVLSQQKRSAANAVTDPERPPVGAILAGPSLSDSPLRARAPAAVSSTWTDLPLVPRPTSRADQAKRHPHAPAASSAQSSTESAAQSGTPSSSQPSVQSGAHSSAPPSAPPASEPDYGI